MSFRPFPATDQHGESRVIIAFIPEPDSLQDGEPAAPRYELDDGRRLQRDAGGFSTLDGELTLRT
ncbi:hypothetical protein [Stenotrophomonas mori]|uniref:Uncharacterized protein n=1 Tax=Stenotrophomonas mori TaxID=2871096 RepID=A0ABT0SE44_9GAMM|nr:hypothetical protein [Stenotrophomonas mori]MCL7713589.1 hypothetical protein [Stenotrophomonas mori]